MSLPQDKATFPWIITSQKVLGSTQANQPQSTLSSVNKALELLIDNDEDLDSRVGVLEASSGGDFISLLDTPAAHLPNQVLTDNGSAVIFETKNTAFNKNFGTSAGTVAEGNHIHDDRYYTETELNTSGGGGQVHVDNIIGGGLGFNRITPVSFPVTSLVVTPVNYSMFGAPDGSFLYAYITTTGGASNSNLVCYVSVLSSGNTIYTAVPTAGALNATGTLIVAGDAPIVNTFNLRGDGFGGVTFQVTVVGYFL